VVPQRLGEEPGVGPTGRRNSVEREWETVDGFIGVCERLAMDGSAAAKDCAVDVEEEESGACRSWFVVRGSFLRVDHWASAGRSVS